MSSRVLGLRAEPPELAPRARLGWLLGSWTALFLASPGILTRDGVFPLAIAALVPWALAASRPGRKAFWIEWLAAAVGLSATCFWTTYVLAFTLVGVALVPAVYMAVAGIVLRRLARAFPLALAAPVAWVGLETLRASFDAPFGFGWLRLGHHAHATEWISGGMRVVGVGGLGFAMAACAGAIGDALRWRATGPVRATRGMIRAGATAVGALAAPALLSRFTRPPATEPGPLVLLVQPAIPQERKMLRTEPGDEFIELCELTRAGLKEARAAGLTPDLVAWGETMFPWNLAEPDVLDAWDRGARTTPWARYQLQREHLETMRGNEAQAVGGVLFGNMPTGARRIPLLPVGASFLAGVELFAVEGSRTAPETPAAQRTGVESAPAAGSSTTIRRRNAVVLWNGRGERAGSGGKIHLVPGAEQLYGLERIHWISELCLALAGYVPDLEALERSAVFGLAAAADASTEATGKSGSTSAPAPPSRWRFSASVCFDNTFEDPYTRAVAEDQVDFHLVVSNEGWYRESFEYDQMVAFSRCLALATGRSFVRATNSGVSCVLDPAGREVARLERGGKDRMVRGTLCARVPVPVAAERAHATVFARWGAAWNLVWIALAALLPWFVRHRAVTEATRRATARPTEPGSELS